MGRKEEGRVDAIEEEEEEEDEECRPTTNINIDFFQKRNFAEECWNF